VDKSACDACVATNTTVGAIVDDRNGSCWRQVHPLERTTWDFGYLSMAYGPTDPMPNPFVAVGANGSAYIRLQDALHTANSNIHGFAKAIVYLEAGDRRFVTKTGSDPEAYLQGSMWVGVLGDETDFSALPSISQSASVAVALGAVREAATADDRPVVCGSPGEVAAVPELGNHFLYQSLLNSWVQWGRADLYRPYWTHGVIAPSKLAAFTSVVLSAPDQLRQRVAWALSQQFVISADNGDLDGNTIHIHDIWLSYYDIFVRNAFGSFRDVFKEVSRSRPLPPPPPPTTASHPADVSIPLPPQVAYHPAMATYLTFIGSRCHSYRLQVADENFARESLQLFTIGLWKLNGDGTHVLDGAGARVPTYNERDLFSFARVWTGFEQQARSKPRPTHP